MSKKERLATSPALPERLTRESAAEWLDEIMTRVVDDGSFEVRLGTAESLAIREASRMLRGSAS